MIVSEHIVHFDMIKLRNQRNRIIAGRRIKVLTKYANKMRKKGYTIENIKPEERGYTGNGLFHGIRVIKN